jgi:glutathione S-transferase
MYARFAWQQNNLPPRAPPLTFPFRFYAAAQTISVQTVFSSERHDAALQSPRFAVQCAKPRPRSVAATGDAMYKLYSMRRSGNCYKVRLALAQLEIAHELIEIDILKGETRTPEFLSINPSGQVPLLEVAPSRYIAESNAILWHIAADTPLVPKDGIDRAEALQWMFFEQHSLEPNIGAAYFWLTLVKGGRELQQHALEDWIEGGSLALGVMEKHLARHDFFVAGRYTIADIALYAYTHVAHECDFDLTRYPRVRAWLGRVAAQHNHVTLDWHPAAMAAAQ